MIIVFVSVPSIQYLFRRALIGKYHLDSLIAAT